jgi:GntR family transcriptional repressor for pyruvate dehydrogenase complex
MKLNPVQSTNNDTTQNTILSKIRDYVDLRWMDLGDKLPSERILSQLFEVSRRNICDAIETLESYGLVESIAKTGIYLATDRTLFSGVIEGLVSMGEEDFLSVVESRLMLENQSVYFAASRRTDQDLEEIENAFQAYKTKLLSKENALGEDLLFHLAIAKASKNSTIYGMMLQIIPKINSVFIKTRVKDATGFDYEIKKHQAIFEAIKNKDPQEAVRCMNFHFELLHDFCDDFTVRAR